VPAQLAMGDEMLTPLRAGESLRWKVV
jgi:dihydroorotase